MDGKRIQEYWSSEIEALIQTYRQFEMLVPATEPRTGAAHPGEDGRFVEDLLREYLKRYLPAELEVLTGFILRPAVKTGRNGTERKREKDAHSTQLDIVVYQSGSYPVFQRFGNSVVVPPEGVIAIVSVKKHLRDRDVEAECSRLYDAAALCETISSGADSKPATGPYLALVSVSSRLSATTDAMASIFGSIKAAYSRKNDATFDRLVGFIGALDEWSVFKRRPGEAGSSAEYVGFSHRAGEAHLGLQFLLTGILSVYYDETRKNLRRPGFTAFPSGRPHDRELGSIPCRALR
jgi:hypothetical protein